jgi:hypothetical protein
MHMLRESLWLNCKICQIMGHMSMLQKRVVTLEIETEEGSLLELRYGIQD